MPTPKKTSKTKNDKAKTDKKSEVLKPRKAVEKISEDKLEEISGGLSTVNGKAPVAWAIDRS